ncbi:Piso0_004691 [Millerozyma farinosa CBS 7064]|uniref:Piso0_004691 protein n=1 Tax=Pichia sorbitophila (strain ATCC MYA-4447 / BCRC 22081 / CBS 7064 / NBRC 10061 / NRRL Y-12695) TaxID=559304 RepID=G8Y658_PICSO|nr:Piso0_004691 [Millerozyma farinosa CBS 7064]CCE85119.1 Piso0_004691 [Millerozyma farinosa CBS 7064]
MAHQDNDSVVESRPTGEFQINDVESGNEGEDSFDLSNTGLAAEYNGLVEFDGEIIMVDSPDWRNSMTLKAQILTAYVVFILFGLVEQTVGTLIPKFQEFYGVDDVETSLVFLASFTGYFSMALLNNFMHNSFGLKGVTVLGVSSMTLAYLIISFKPPYFIFVLCYILSGIGFGSLDACLNTWMGSLTDSNQLLGILHGCYGIGCMISPPMITGLLERKKGAWTWNEYYELLAIIGSFCLVLSIICFRRETPKKYKYMSIKRGKDLAEDKDLSMNDTEESIPMSSLERDESNTETSPEEESTDINETASSALKSRLIWFLSLILFLYVGGEVAFGQWLVSFMIRIKNAKYKSASYIATSFWTGLTVGRIALGFVTARFFRNELVANMTYILASFCGFFIFWLSYNTSWYFILGVYVFLTGCFVGPIFPTTIVSSIRVLPAKYHTSGIGIICALGGGGGAGVPFIVGLIAESSESGLRLLPAVIGFIFLILAALWWILMTRFQTNVNYN